MSESLIGPFKLEGSTHGPGPGEWYEAMDTRSEKPVILRLVDPGEVPLPEGFDALGSDVRNHGGEAGADPRCRLLVYIII